MITITKKVANKELQNIKNAIIEAKRKLFKVKLDTLKATEALLEVTNAQTVANNTLINVNHEIIFKLGSFIVNQALQCITPKEKYYLN